VTASVSVSEREAEVLEAIGAHLSNAQIARRLHISVRTVESHVSSLLRKFGVPDRRSLADLAPAVAARQQAGTAVVAGLPGARTSFIGRSHEQAEVLAALEQNRLVTLLGPGGVGKTRLAATVALAAAGQYPLGASFVDLVPVREGYVAEAAAAVLGLTERAGHSLDAVLHEHFGRGKALLVLDNCEHLLSVVAVFAEKLLANCSTLTVLATSRERLAIAGERIVGVGPLSVVADGEDGRDGEDGGSEAGRLFLDRACVIDPHFTAAPAVLSELCVRLDGMPLAIELAAARSASLGVDGLLAGLDDHLRLLTGNRGVAERHSSLRAVIDWSHDLLDDDERRMFRKLGVFAGGFDLDAAVSVCAPGNRGLAADLVGRLTDKSLLVHRGDTAGSRWQMLDTIRGYALDRLAASGEESTVRAAHLRWAGATADSLERLLVEGADWGPTFDVVADDLRAATASAAVPDEQDLRHQLARGLGHLTYARRFLGESREHYQTAAALAAQPSQAASDLRTAADVAMAEGDGARAFDLLLASADRAAAAQDGRGRAVALAWAATIADRFAGNFQEEKPTELLQRLVTEASSAAPADDLITAAYLASAVAWTAHPEKSVSHPDLAHDALAAARRTGDPVLINAALDGVIVGLDTSGRLREAHQLSKERAALLTSMPRHEPRCGTEIADTLYMLAEISVTAGDLPAALTAARMASEDEIGGQPYLTAAKPILPLVLQGRFDEALELADNMWQAWEQAGRPVARTMGTAAYAVVLAHGLRGDVDGCRRWVERVRLVINGSGAHQAGGTNLVSFAAFIDARIAMHEGRIDAALAAVADLPIVTEPWYGTLRWYSLRPYTWAIAAEVAAAARLPDADSRLAAAAPAGKENYWAEACLARATGRLTGDRAALEQSLASWERIGASFERACTLLLLDERADEGRAQLRALGCRDL
jgi:predicted ATPase/DNA-binding CsgD family transcriptional regulator